MTIFPKQSKLQWKWDCFANLFNAWLSRRQPDPHICFCIKPLVASRVVEPLQGPLDTVVGPRVRDSWHRHRTFFWELCRPHGFLKPCGHSARESGEGCSPYGLNPLAGALLKEMGHFLPVEDSSPYFCFMAPAFALAPSKTSLILFLQFPSSFS